jgi:formylmethanofuran dehydrogenase subunit E
VRAGVILWRMDRRALALLLLAACSRSAPPASADTALARVAAIHGAAGPFAVAGYRVGERALRELGLPAGTFDLDVVHESPAQVQWSCIADGVQAATGASAGKLNLHLREVEQARMRTVVRQKSTGRTLVFHLKPSFASRFLDRPRAELPHAGGEVMALPDDEIFSVEPASP